MPLPHRHYKLQYVRLFSNILSPRTLTASNRIDKDLASWTLPSELDLGNVLPVFICLAPRVGRQRAKG